MRHAAPIEYGSAASLKGALLGGGGGRGAGWDEGAEGRLDWGELRHGLVLEVDWDVAVVQVFEGTTGLSLNGVRVSFQGGPMRIPVGEAWLGRVCNRRGRAAGGG